MTAILWYSYNSYQFLWYSWQLKDADGHKWLFWASSEMCLPCFLLPFQGKIFTPFHVRPKVHKFVLREYFLVNSCLQKPTFLSQSSVNWLNWVLVFFIFSHPCGTECREGELGTTIGSLLSAHPEVVVGFGAAAFPAERSCSQSLCPAKSCNRENQHEPRDGEAWLECATVYCLFTVQIFRMG